ncbi:MAG: HAD family hydrolase [Thermodesulfobacteriota bacterium]
MTGENHALCTKPFVCFDFGGVIAEEGFYQGLKAIAHAEKRNPEEFVPLAVKTILQTGYVLGKASEADFWAALRAQSGITWTDQQLREAILNHFVPRPSMLQLLSALGQESVHLALLSDQTNWLDELDAVYGLYALFDSVHNSYVTGLHKGQQEFFTTVLQQLGARPEQCVFIDDNPNNIQVAREVGLETVLFRDVPGFVEDFARYCPSAVTTVFT